jgi:hypothetical protein
MDRDPIWATIHHHQNVERVSMLRMVAHGWTCDALIQTLQKSAPTPWCRFSTGCRHLQTMATPDAVSAAIVVVTATTTVMIGDNYEA